MTKVPQTGASLDGRGHQLVMAVVIALVVGATMGSAIIGVEMDPDREELQAASDEVVTNCDHGPGCGTLPLLKISGVLFAGIFVASASWQAIRKFRDRLAGERPG